MATSRRATVSNGNRNVSLDQALAQAGDTHGMLRDSAAQALSIEEAANRIASMGSEQSAASYQIRASIEAMSALIEETATAVQELARSQVHVSETTRDIQQGHEGTSAGQREVASSVSGVKKDGEALALSAENMAAMIEEAARAIKGVGVNAEDLAAAGEELLAAATETAQSEKDVSERGHNSATAMNQIAATISGMAK